MSRELPPVDTGRPLSEEYLRNPSLRAEFKRLREVRVYNYGASGDLEFTGFAVIEGPGGSPIDYKGNRPLLPPLPYDIVRRAEAMAQEARMLGV